MKRMSGATMLALGRWILLAGAPCICRADVVATQGRPPSVDAQILALDEGRLHYRLQTGREVSRPIEEVDYLQITDWPLFNLAEKQQRDGQLRQAARSYERVLADLAGDDRAGGPAASRLDRRLLAQCRLLGVYDRQGRFDRAVAMYLEVIERAPILLETLRPANVPAAGSTFLESARTQVDQAIARYGPDQTGLSLARWRNEWAPDAGQPDAATQPASRPAAEISPALLKKLELVGRSVEAGRFGEALERSYQIRDAPPDVWLAEWYYWRGRAWLGTASGEQAKGDSLDHRRAGLAFMRVVIHFPGHPLAPECLWRAGEVCARTGEPEQAATLWSELVMTYPAAAPWAGRAREALGRAPGNARAAPSE